MSSISYSIQIFIANILIIFECVIVVKHHLGEQYKLFTSHLIEF